MSEPEPELELMALVVDDDEPVSIFQQRTARLPTGLTLGSLDTGGISWYLTDIVGWDGVGTTGELTQRSGRHGGWRNRAVLTPRYIQFQGRAMGEPQALYRAAGRLVNAIPLDEPDVFTITEGELVRQIAGRQHDIPLIKHGPGFFTFDVQIQCPDPRRLSGQLENTGEALLPSSSGGLEFPFTFPFEIDAVVTDNTVDISNSGNIAGPARLRIIGPVQMPRVRHVEQSRELSFSIALEAGQFLDVDLDEHTVMLNGTANRRGITSGQWFTIEPGLQSLAFDASDFSAAILQVFWRSAWR